MAYSLDLDRAPDGGLLIRREPGMLPRGIGLAFQLTGGLFLLALPLALAEAGPTGVLSALLSAGIGLGLGRGLRETRREVEIDAKRRSVVAGWWMGERLLPIGRIRLRVAERGARVEGIRVRTTSENGTTWMWGVRVIPSARDAGAVLVYVDTPGDAERVGEAIADRLAIEHRPWQNPSSPHS